MALHTDFKAPQSKISIAHHNPRNALDLMDIPQILAIEKECFAIGMRYSSEKTQFNLTKYPTIIARDDKKSVIGILFYRDEGSALHITSLSVARTSQKSGAGSALMQALIATAKQAGKTVILEALARNQPYYSRFGFVTQKATSSYSDVHYLDETTGAKSKIGYPIAELKMTLDPKNEQAGAAPKPREKKEGDISADAKGMAAANAVKNLALFAKANTSFCYHWLTKSGEKEKALRSIQQELDIHLSPIKEKTVLTQEVLAKMVFGIIRNAMIVRGFGIFSTQTTGGSALLNLLKGTQDSTLIDRGQVVMINHLLQEFYQIDVAKLSYEELRTRVFGAENFYSKSATHNPYLYYSA